MKSPQSKISGPIEEIIDKEIDKTFIDCNYKTLLIKNQDSAI